MLGCISFGCSVMLKIECDQVPPHGRFSLSGAANPRPQHPQSSPLQSVDASPPSKCTFYMQKTCQDECHLGSFILYPFATLKIQSPRLLELLPCDCWPMTLLVCWFSNPTFLSTQRWNQSLMFGSCYTESLCSPKIYMINPNTQDDGIWGWELWEMIRS